MATDTGRLMPGGGLEVDLTAESPMTDEDIEVRFGEDGSAELMMGEEIEEDRAPTEGFQENLAEKLDDDERREMATDLMEMVSTDEESRADWYERLEDGLTLLGIKDVPEDRLPFPKAARVTHPVLVEIITQFQARAIEELFPSGGPVKTTVIGDQSDEKVKQAERVSEYMNYHLTDLDEDYFPDTDQMLYYAPYSGSVFRKVYYDHLLGYPVARYVKAEDFVVPYEARSLREASRYTHKFKMARNDVKRLMSEGVFIEYDMPEGAGIDPDQEDHGRKMESTSDKREPTQSVMSGEDTLEIHEMHIDLDFDEDKQGSDNFKSPYIVTIDVTNQDILCIRRNWRENDEAFRKRLWFAHYKYLPGFGFYGWGIMHVVGSLGAAASGAVRALLDSAMRQNTQGGFKSKDLRVSGDLTIEPGVWKDVDATAEEMTKGLYSPQWGAPSPALFQLLEGIVQSTRSFAAITENMVGEASNTGPVGTTIALIEQSMKVFSAIHKRLHQAARTEFRMLAELIHETMPEYYEFANSEHDTFVRSDDFDERVDVVPVSDPNIFSSTQRIAIAQAVLQMVQSDNRGMFDDEAVWKAYRRMMEALRVSDIDGILPDMTTKRMDPVSENQNMLTGHPVRVFADQAHEPHIQVHRAFLFELEQAGDQHASQMIAPVMEAHIKQHEAYLYRIALQQALLPMGIELPALDFNDTRNRPDVDPQTDNAIAMAAAQIVNQQTAQRMMLAQQQAEQQAAAEMQQQQAQQQAEQGPRPQDIATENKDRRAEEKHQLDMARETETMNRDLAQREMEDIQREVARVSGNRGGSGE